MRQKKQMKIFKTHKAAVIMRPLMLLCTRLFVILWVAWILEVVH